MSRRRYSHAFIALVLKDAARKERPLQVVLRQHGVPERTFHHWRRRFPSDGRDALDTIRSLEQEIRTLRRENRELAEALKLQRELMGKPWRRSPPGARPSGT